MRAGITLEALASAYAVHLVVVPVAGSTDLTYIPPFVRERTTSIFIDPLENEPDPVHDALASDDPARAAAFLLGWPEPLFCRFATARRLKRLSMLAAGVVPRIVHVMRLYMAPYAAPFLECRPRPAAVLDLDDDEVGTHADLSELHARNGRLAEARLAARESERFREAEWAWLGWFDRVLLASSADMRRVADRTALTRLELFPNAVRLPRIHASGAPMASLLFVGNLSYAPNQDAAIWLCRELLPRLRVRRRVRVRIVGGGAGPSVRALAPLPGVEIVGPVDDLAPEYKAAGVVVVPIRAGGGTRIKLIEALAYGKPVVSTSIGATGIAVDDGHHLVIADDAAEFAQACLGLLGDPAEARSLGARGRKLVRERYASDVVGARLVSLFRELYPSSPFGGRRAP
jgi:glycosyltransferase involved in cell wall biosynthesis